MTAAEFPLVRLARVASLNPSLTEVPADCDVVSFLPMSAIDAAAVDAVDKETRRFQEVSKGYTPFTSDDILVAKITPCFENGKIAQARLTHRFGFGSTEFHVVRPDPSALDPRFLVHFLRQERIRKEGERKMTGSAGQRRVPEYFLANLLIPLPPVAEQRQIADILDKADALRAKRQVGLDRIHAVAQSSFHAMFGGDSRYELQALESVCELITDGTHYTPTYSDSGVLFLSSRNVTSGYIDWDDVKYIPASLHRELNQRVAPRVNDILLAKNGTTGIAAVVDRDCIFDIYVSLALLRPAGSVLPIYLREAINSPSCRRQFAANLKGIGVPNLHLKEIRRAKIPVPPRELQHEFVRRVAAIERAKISYKESLSQLEALFGSLQYCAFRGEL